MKEPVKLKLVDLGIPMFKLKRNIIGKEEVIDRSGKWKEKNLYEIDKKFCKERYNEIVNLLPMYNGKLLIYGINKCGERIRIDYIKSSGGIRNDFKSLEKDGMGRYEWMMNNIEKGKLRRIDFKLGVSV